MQLQVSWWVFCSQAYGFTSQQFLFSVYGTLRAPSVQRMTAVVKQVGLDWQGFNTWHRAVCCCDVSRPAAFPVRNDEVVRCCRRL